MSDEDYKVIEAMETYGGSFVQALAVCFHRADDRNFEKLQLAFADIWLRYKNLANSEGRVHYSQSKLKDADDIDPRLENILELGSKPK